MKEIDSKEMSLRFGSFIQEGRFRKKYTQRDMAALLGISQVYYCHIEQGKRTVDFFLAVEICKKLDLDINDFVKTL